MIGFVATSGDEPQPSGPTIDPPTWAHPARGLAAAQAKALTAPHEQGAAVLAAMWIVDCPDDEWAPACPDCLRAVGLMHDCTGVAGPVRTVDAVLMHAGRVRT